jgi:hypothetical protein
VKIEDVFPGYPFEEKEPPPPPSPPDQKPPPPVWAPSSLYSSWANSAQILKSKDKSVDVEGNQTFGVGGAGGLQTQISARIGVTEHLELGVVGNLNLGDTSTGQGGATAHIGDTDIDPGKSANGWIFQGTAGTAPNPSGKSEAAVNLSGSRITTEGGDVTTPEKDTNIGLSYSSLGSFGPGTASVRNLVQVPLVHQRTYFLDPLNSNSFFGEGLVAPSVAFGPGTSLAGARIGLGTGFTNATDRSLFSLSAHGYLDVTSQGVGVGAFLMITIAGRAGPRPPQPKPDSN